MDDPDLEPIGSGASILPFLQAFVVTHAANASRIRPDRGSCSLQHPAAENGALFVDVLHGVIRDFLVKIALDIAKLLKERRMCELRVPQHFRSVLHKLVVDSTGSIVYGPSDRILNA